MEKQTIATCPPLESTNIAKSGPIINRTESGSLLERQVSFGIRIKAG